MFSLLSVYANGYFDYSESDDSDDYVYKPEHFRDRSYREKGKDASSSRCRALFNPFVSVLKSTLVMSRLACVLYAVYVHLLCACTISVADMYQCDLT